MAVLATALTSNGISYLNVINPDVRADPFTMTDWLKGKAEITKHIDSSFEDGLARHVDNEKDIQYLQYRMAQCEKLK